MSKWIEVQEGSFLRHPQAQGASSRDAGWVTTGFWGAWPPFFVIPSFIFKLAFWVVLLRSFGQSFMRWSGLPHLTQFWFFLWYNSIALAKQMIYPTYWYVPPTPLEVSVSSPAEDLTSSSPSGFMPKSSSASLLSTVADQVVRVRLPFNFLGGTNSLRSENELLLILQLQWFLGVEDLRLLPIFPISGLLGAGQSSQQGVHHWLYGPTFVSVWGQALVEVISLHLLYVLWLDPSRKLWLECLDLLWWCTTNLAMFFPDPCLRE